MTNLKISDRRSAAARTLLACLLVGVGLNLPSRAVAQSHALGLLPEDQVAFRGFPRTQTFRAYIPPSVDWSARMPPVGDQGQQGSCVGWAVGYAARSYYTYAETPRPAPVSPAYIFDNIRDDARDCKSGSIISRALDLLRNGAVTIDAYPYSDSVCMPARIGPSGATGFRIRDWSTVDHTNLDDIKGQLARGNPVIISLSVTPEIDRLVGAQPPIVPPDAKILGRHAITIVGYDEARRAFKLINSWGTKWGDKGYGWISFADVPRLVNAAYVLTPAQPSAPAVAPTVAPPTDTAAAVDRLRGEIASVAAGKACRPVTVTLQNGVVQVTGSVASEKEQAAVLRLLNVSKITYRQELKVKPWPGCELEETLASALAVPDRPRLSTPNGQTRFKAGDSIVFSIARPPRASYLYVFYISADGNVVTLAQPGAVAKPEPAGGSLNFGDGSPKGGRFKVTAPFGAETIVAVATARPLFNAPLKPGQVERQALTVIRDAANRLASTGGPDAWIGADLFTLATAEN